MTIQSLSTVTLATIENYRHAANEFNHAYRDGSRRLIGALNAGFEKTFDGRAAEVAPAFTGKLLKARGRVSEIVVKGIDEVASRTERTVDTGADGAVRQVHKATEFAAGIANPTLANGLRAAARLSLPTAKLALAVSDKVAEGAQALSAAAKGKRTKAKSKVAAASVKRRATRAKSRTRAEAGVRAKAAPGAAKAPRKAAARAMRRPT